MSEPKAPYVVQEEPGEKYWCACGASANQPYCDGSHSRSNAGTTPIRVVIDHGKQVAWCGCRRSQNVPYCDGTHSKV